jgi:hypothetical protein
MLLQAANQMAAGDVLMDRVDATVISVSVLFLGWLIHKAWKAEREAKEQCRNHEGLIRALLKKGNKK